MSRSSSNFASPKPQTQPACDPALLPDLCRLALDRISILPIRMQLDEGAASSTVAMLRGVWGKAIHELFPEIYRDVFEVESRPGPASGSPPYIVRGAPPSPEWIPAVETILVGNAVPLSADLLRCWDYAAANGLGKERRVAEIKRRETVSPDQSTRVDGESWPLSQAHWPIAVDAPCRIAFRVPVRLRRKGRLIDSPTLADLVVSINRRIAGFLPTDLHDLWKRLSAQLLEVARNTPQGEWEGERSNVTRYSGRQKTEVDLHGVVGSLVLPQGIGALAPVMAAAQWLHLGKNTTIGMGQPLVEPLERGADPPGIPPARQAESDNTTEG